MRDSICNDCAERTRCDMAEIGRGPLAISACYCYKKGNPTHADRIRGEDDEGLAEFIYSEMFLIPWCDMDCGNAEEPPCRKCVLKWLKQECE